MLGDIYARYQTIKRNNVTLVAGADQNNTYTEKKAEIIDMMFSEEQELYSQRIFNKSPVLILKKIANLTRVLK